MSKSYAFDFSHSHEYSTECLQELNLYYFYPKIYWNAATVITQAQTEDERDNASTAVDYGKIAQSIYKARKNDIIVNAPSIQESGLTFSINDNETSILYGLGAIAGINVNIASQIISNRPYASFADFYDKNAYTGSLVTNSKFITLIKAGCFDEFEPNRIKVMKQFIVLSTPTKSSLTMANLNEALRIGAKPPRQLIVPYNFKHYVCSKQFFYGAHPNFKSKKLYWLDDKAMRYFNSYCIGSLREDVDWWRDEEGLTIVVDKALDKLFAPTMNQLKEYINTPEFLELFNKKLYLTKYNELLPNQDPNHWSFEATSFYSQEHELANIDKERYSITPFDELPEEPEFIIKKSGNREWKQFAISRIAGVVIARSDNNHLLTVLDMNNNVVQCKFDGFHYAKYKAQISIPDGKGGETVVDTSWFKRGQPIILAGVRTGENEFRVKVYKNSIFDKRVIKILKVDNNTGELELQYERYNESEEE